MLVGSVVEDQFGDHPQAARVRLAQERLEIVQRAVDRVDGVIIGDVVAVVLERRGIKRQQPEGRDAEVLEVIQLLRQPAKIADAVGVAVVEARTGTS